MFSGCRDLYNIGHPNRLEVNGNKIYKEAFTLWYERQKGRQEEGRPVEEVRGACARRCMVVVTINRVQSIYSNPVYDRCVEVEIDDDDTQQHRRRHHDHLQHDEQEHHQQNQHHRQPEQMKERDCEIKSLLQQDCGTESLRSLLDTDLEMHEERYLVTDIRSVHVGGLYLRKKRCNVEPTACDEDGKDRNGSIVSVSVVMPARNAEDFLGEAIESIRRQTLRDFEASR